MAEELRILISDGGGNLGSGSQQSPTSGGNPFKPTEPGGEEPAKKSDLLRAVAHVGGATGFGRIVELLRDQQSLTASFKTIFAAFAKPKLAPDEKKDATTQALMPVAEDVGTSLARKSSVHLEHIEELLKELNGRPTRLPGKAADRPAWMPGRDGSKGVLPWNMPQSVASRFKSRPAVTFAEAGKVVAEEGEAGAVSGVAGTLAKLAPAAAAVTVAMGVAAAATYGLKRQFDGLAEKFKRYNPQLAVGEALRDASRIFRDFDRAQKFGPGLDRFRDAEFRIENSLIRIGDAIQGPILDRFAKLAEIAAKLLEVVSKHSAAIEKSSDRFLSELLPVVVSMLPVVGSTAATALRAYTALSKIERHVKPPPADVSKQMFDDLIQSHFAKEQVNFQKPRNDGFFARGRAGGAR